jgi:hypothetical protein
LFSFLPLHYWILDICADGGFVVVVG